MEPGGGIDEDGGGIDLPQKPQGAAVILRDNGLRMLRAIPRDMLDRLIHVFDNPNRQNQVQELRSPVGLFGRCHTRRENCRSRTPAHVDARLLITSDQRRQKFMSDSLMDQEGFHCVTGAWSLDLGIEANRLGHF